MEHKARQDGRAKLFGLILFCRLTETAWSVLGLADTLGPDCLEAGIAGGTAWEAKACRLQEQLGVQWSDSCDLFQTLPM